MDFKNKYLKYKKKYSELKKQIGGLRMISETEDDDFNMNDHIKFPDELHQMLYKYHNDNSVFDVNTPPQLGFKPNTINRGLCGLFSNNILKFLKGKFNLDSDNGLYYGNITEEYKYVKIGCICSEPCVVGVCKDDTRPYDDSCSGHFFIIISKNKDKGKIYDDDRIIDFTYKQFLISREGYDDRKELLSIEENRETGIWEERWKHIEDTQKIKEKLELLPPFIDTNYSSYNRLFDNKLWIDNVTNPCKKILNIRC